MGVRIITDSASDISEAQYDKLTVIPMTITFGEIQYLDGVNLSNIQFYEKLIEMNELPVTSQISPYDFEKVYEQVKADGDTAVVITMSGKLSGTYNSALTAAESYKDTIKVVDSQSVTVGERILVDYAVMLRDTGIAFDQLAKCLEEKKKDICLLALLDTLEYLKKGGRISKAAAFAGSVLSIKPVVAVENGEVVILGKARGSKHGNNMLAEMIEQKGGIDFSLPIMLGYTGLSNALLEKYIIDSASLWVGYKDELPKGVVGGTIGTHAGPGAIAVAFFHKN